MRRELSVMVLVLAVVGLNLSWSVSMANSAEKYPVRPVVIVVGYNAGSATDIDGRFLAQYLPKYLGQPVLVENHAGAGGVQGAMVVMKSKPDGYTTLIVGGTLYFSYHTLPGAPDPRLLEPVAQIFSYSRLLAVSEKSGFKKLEDMVTFAKKNPRKLLVGVNPGGTSQLDTVSLVKALNIDVKYVPFKSGAERAVALAGGHIQVSVDTLSSLRPYFDSKKAAPLGITSRERSETCKDVPTFIEQGVNVVLNAVEGIFVPKGTPEDVIQTLEAALEKTCKEKTFIEQLSKNYIDIDFLKRDDFKRFLADEDIRLKNLTQELGLAKPSN